MSGENILKASEKLAAHIAQIDDYINLTNVKFSTFKEEYLLAANLSLDDLKKLANKRY